MAGTAIKVSDLMNKAQELKDEREGTLAAQAANREILRNLNLSGMLSEEEAEQLEYYYPTRTRVRGEDEEEGE